MPRSRPALDSLTSLLDRSNRPIYAVDAGRRIIYGNAALAAWIELEPARIIGRLVEYHSEPAEDRAAGGDALAPLTDLCPPPRALAGDACGGTISCVARDGRLIHRHAEFVPLSLVSGAAGDGERGPAGVLVLMADCDLSPQQLAAELAGEASADELHRTIRQFRRAQTGRFAIASLLGNSSAMQKVRAQVAAAAACGANVLIVGRPGTGRGHVARAIHYRLAGDAAVKLVPIDCELATEHLLRRSLDAVRYSSTETRQRPTLLLENLDRLTAPYQSQLVVGVRQNALPARIIATVADEGERGRGGEAENERPRLDPALADAISTITIRMPRLAERLEDLPILAQYFLESANRGSGKQVGSLRTDALDLLALHSWPGELDELREVVAAARREGRSHEITPADLPPVIRHAASAAAHVRRPPERVVLDELLATIEKEAIVRALAQAGGNKTEAAELLGMTRPRLYRRLVQLGLAGPEFIEQEWNEDLP